MVFAICTAIFQVFTCVKTKIIYWYIVEILLIAEIGFRYVYSTLARPSGCTQDITWEVNKKTRAYELLALPLTAQWPVFEKSSWILQLSTHFITIIVYWNFIWILIAEIGVLCLCLLLLWYYYTFLKNRKNQ